MDVSREDHAPRSVWTITDTRWACFWVVAGWLARIPLVTRAEGLLDHDQSVVGLMALDIASGKRLPLFFDGQRYMAAIEAYVAALAVGLFGHGPVQVALAPLFFHGLFVAGQFIVWRLWAGRRAGILAALLAAVGSPMLALWGIVPRGGYIEVLAWTLPVLAMHRRLVAVDAPRLAGWRQAGWGFLLALGYVINPLSLVVYVTLVVDWTFVIHGPELRSRLESFRFWPRTASIVLAAPVLGALWVLAMAFCVHVDPRAIETGSPYLAFGGRLQGPVALALGGGLVVGLLLAAGWATGFLPRFRGLLLEYPAAVLGAIVALSPFVLQGILTKAGVLEPAPSLPVWLAAPWKSGHTLVQGLGVLGSLLGCSPDAMETVLVGQGIEPPDLGSGTIVTCLRVVAPAIGLLAAWLVIAAAWSLRHDLACLARLEGAGSTSPAVLALGYLGVALALFSLQATSPNASCVRYLVPLGAVLPGLIALGLEHGPRGWRAARLVVLLGCWLASQGVIVAAAGRDNPARPLVAELERRNVSAIVAPTPIALVVANLSAGRIGALEYQPIWPRLGTRYHARFAGDSLYCVTDRRFPWAIRGEGGWSPSQDLEGHLRQLERRWPGSVTHLSAVGGFDVWETRRPLDEVLAAEDVTTPSGVDSISRLDPSRHDAP